MADILVAAFMTALRRALPPLVCDASCSCASPTRAGECACTATRIVAGTAALSARIIEPAGSAHQRLAVQRVRVVAAPSGGGHGGAHASASAASHKRAKAEDDGDSDGEEDSSPASMAHLLLAAEAGSHYDVLGLGSLGTSATAEDIKRAYRSCVLRHHPDKAGVTAAPGAATDPIFLAIQRAYDVLSNEKSRRAYDSEFDFDDSIPPDRPLRSGEDANPSVFFDTYGLVFARNARWSVKKPVPPLGKLDDDDERVNAFYAFWFEFETWRDFSSLCEHNPEEAESRDEKRWMERENQRAVAKARKAEVQRIWDLTSRAYARDPRIARMKAAQDAAKRAVKDARAASKRAAEEAVRRREQELAAMAKADEESRKAEAAARKAAKEAEKKLLKKLRNTVRQRTAGMLPEANVDLLCSDACALPELQRLVTELDAPGCDVASVAGAAVAAITVRKRETAAKAAATPAPAPAAAPTAAPSSKEREWSVHELSMLAKGVAKYPPGTRNRWQMIADYVNGLGQPLPRSPDECIAKSRALGEEEKKQAGKQAFQTYLASRKETEIRDRDAEVRPAAAATATTAATPPAALAAAKAAAPAPAPTTAAAPTAGAQASTDATVAPPGGADDGCAGVWTQPQQEALEAALKKYPASMDKNERWKAIADAVPGKTKKECIARFKELREAVLAKGAAK